MVVRSMFDLSLLKVLPTSQGVHCLTCRVLSLMVMRNEYKLHLIEGLVMQSSGGSS